METATDVTTAIHTKEKEEENGSRSVTCIMQNFIAMYELYATKKVLCETRNLKVHPSSRRNDGKVGKWIAFKIVMWKNSV